MGRFLDVWGRYTRVMGRVFLMLGSVDWENKLSVYSQRRTKYTNDTNNTVVLLVSAPGSVL